MIQPGQKLTEGDYFIPESWEQSVEIIFMDGNRHSNHFDMNELPIYYIEKYGLMPDYTRNGNSLETEYDFPDFRQLCENTFGVLWDLDLTWDRMKRERSLL